MRSYFTFEFILYIGRWILSASIMMIPLYLLQKYKITESFGRYREYVDLIIV